MQILVVVEHDCKAIRTGSLCAMGFARALAQDKGGGVTILAIGAGLETVSTQAATLAPVLRADSAALKDVTADRYGKVIADVVTDQAFDMVIATASTFAKDVMGRAGGLLGGVMASEVVGYEWQGDDLILRRPMFAGSVNAKVKLIGGPKVLTVRPSVSEPAQADGTTHAITDVAIDEAALPNHIQVKGVETKHSGRPDVTEARIVVSGGRAIKNSDDFEKYIGGLADCVGGAAGSSRVLVDAGIAPNELQVGQTGKVVAPDLYLAMGISGAVQHLAGMKNSKVIAAVNSDPDAPIFEVADFGLVGDVYQIIPEMIDKLNGQG